MPWVFLTVSTLGAWLSWNAYRPFRRHVVLAGVSFFAGWLTSELAVHQLLFQLAATGILVWLGALEAWPGWVALAISTVSWWFLWGCLRRARGAEQVVEKALAEGLGASYREALATLEQRVEWRHLALPLPLARGLVVRERNIVFTEGEGYRMKLDVYRAKDAVTLGPTLLQIHGGGWILGSKDDQGLPLMHHMAARGWTCISANYRLSPRAQFPAHVVDIKQAIRWIKEHGAAHGADPSFIVVTGGSAGGHLAALTALSANDPHFQPGFEQVDTTVQGCVCFYGVYDFTDRGKLWPHKGLARLLERSVMKAALASATEAYERASPLVRVHEHAPPFFIIHGDADSVVPVAEARQFADALRAVTKAPVVYAEIPGAQHAFEVFPSLRSTIVIHGVERFLTYLRADRASS